MSAGELKSSVKEVTCLPVGQPTKQQFLAMASAPTVITKTTDISCVESNSKPKKISGAWAGPTIQSVVSKIKVERADPMEVAPAASSELYEPELGWCVACKKSVEDFTEHLKHKHIQQCSVRVCHIETCDLCLSSFSGLKVAIASDVEDEDSSEDEEENDSRKDEAARPETMVLDRPCKTEPVDV
uniref:Polytene chromosome n=1 Tax=Rhipicephalus appendiculatus TaxID=34631 RepID=A0A131YX79_RHIAP